MHQRKGTFERAPRVCQERTKQRNGPPQKGGSNKGDGFVNDFGSRRTTARPLRSSSTSGRSSAWRFASCAARRRFGGVRRQSHLQRKGCGLVFFWVKRPQKHGGTKKNTIDGCFSLKGGPQKWRYSAWCPFKTNQKGQKKTDSLGGPSVGGKYLSLASHLVT